MLAVRVIKGAVIPVSTVPLLMNPLRNLMPQYLRFCQNYGLIESLAGPLALDEDCMRSGDEDRIKFAKTMFATEAISIE